LWFSPAPLRHEEWGSRFVGSTSSLFLQLASHCPVLGIAKQHSKPFESVQTIISDLKCCTANKRSMIDVTWLSRAFHRDNYIPANHGFNANSNHIADFFHFRIWFCRIFKFYLFVECTWMGDLHAVAELTAVLADHLICLIYSLPESNPAKKTPNIGHSVPAGAGLHRGATLSYLWEPKLAVLFAFLGVKIPRFLWVFCTSVGVGLTYFHTNYNGRDISCYYKDCGC